MKLRIQTLWKVPVFCIVASAVSYYLTIYLGGFFFAATTVGTDGITEISADPIRSAIFSGFLFLAVLLLGGLWFLRSMTRKEIAISAAIISVIYLTIVLAQLLVEGFPLAVSMKLAIFQNWITNFCSILLLFTDRLEFVVLLSCLAPFLFVPFGKKCKQ